MDHRGFFVHSREQCSARRASVFFLNYPIVFARFPWGFGNFLLQVKLPTLVWEGRVQGVYYQRQPLARNLMRGWCFFNAYCGYHSFQMRLAYFLISDICTKVVCGGVSSVLSHRLNASLYDIASTYIASNPTET